MQYVKRHVAIMLLALSDRLGRLMLMAADRLSPLTLDGAVEVAAPEDDALGDDPRRTAALSMLDEDVTGFLLFTIRENHDDAHVAVIGHAPNDAWQALEDSFRKVVRIREGDE